jgi:hypothetical protein
MVVVVHNWVISTLTVAQSRLVSFYTRANYDIGGKLMLTGTVRRDGSSKFGADNKWGVFPIFRSCIAFV